jgi:predicted metal-dependent hydrolase
VKVGSWISAPTSMLRSWARSVPALLKWIVDRRRQAEAMPPPPAPREFVSGETFMYRGRQYRLRVTAGAEAGAEASVKLVAGHLEVTAAAGDISGGASGRRAGPARRVVPRAGRRRSCRGWVAVWAEKVGVQPRAVMIRDQKKRWGSCDAKGNLRFNWRVVQLPTRLVDYIVAHEVVQLVVPDLSRAHAGSPGVADPRPTWASARTRRTERERA